MRASCGQAPAPWKKAPPFGAVFFLIKKHAVPVRRWVCWAVFDVFNLIVCLEGYELFLRQFSVFFRGFCEVF